MARQRSRRRTRELLAAALACLVCVGAAACGEADPANKTGDDTVVLSLGTIDDLNPNGQTPAPAAFIRSLTELSGGTMKIEVKGQIGGGGGDADTELVDQIDSGTLDLGIPVMRGFAAAGFPGFKALEAPMVVSSYEAEKDVVRSDLAGRLLATLDGTTMVGLALTPGPLRRPFSAHALRAPDNWHGLRFRSLSSLVQDATITALGAFPVRAGFNFPELAAEGELDGVELDIAQYAKDHYAMFPAAVRNVVLWPRMTVLTMNRARFDGLTEKQRGWITAAAADAVQTALAFDFDESDAVVRTCKRGVVYSDASDADLAAMKQAVKPVLQSIAADPVAGPLLPELQAVAAKYPASVPAVPKACLTP